MEPIQPLMHESCQDFAAKLAAKIGTPGGGSAAAYAGALGAALAGMVVNFTLGKPRYADYEDDLQEALGRADAIRERLLALVQEDAEALVPLTAAYGIPRDDPARAEVLEQATLGACRAPREMMTLACEAIELFEELQGKCSRLLLSDVGCGAVLSVACLQTAAVNVFVNTAALLDRVVADELEAECDELLAEFVPRAQAVYAGVMESIRAAGC